MNMKKNKIFLTVMAVLFATLCGVAQNTQIVFSSLNANDGSAEKEIDLYAIHPEVSLSPLPVDVVEVNPPTLHFKLEGKVRRSHPIPAIFRFQLSQNTSFSSDVIESGLKKWSFFRPENPLAPGTWYWRYAVESNWSETYSFTILGNERIEELPSTDEFLNAVTAAGHPRILAFSSEIGSLLPDNNPALKTELENYCEGLLNKSIPSTYLFDESVIPEDLRETLTEKQKTVYRLKRTRDLFTKTVQKKAVPLIKAYVLTKDPEYKVAAISAMDKLRTGFIEMEANDMDHEFAIVSYHGLIGNYFDVFYEQISEEQRAEFAGLLAEEARSRFRGHVRDIEHRVMHEHGWQAGINNLFHLALLTYGEVDEAEDWLRYVYELWLFRGPQVGGNDGGSLLGNGYLGAHRRTLIKLPLFMSRFTGVNYFNHPWYQNVGKYAFYTNPPGHPAGAYGDNADREKVILSILTRILEHVNADQSGWSTRRNNTLNGGNIDSSSYLTTSLWYLLHKHEMIPPLPKIVADEVMPAECFRDVGAAAMHSNLEDPDNNLMVNFRSNPYGLAGHGHAAQNAFTVTYGGEKLFFKTGYYTSASDFHSLQDYKHPRAQNTILADGIGTGYSTSGYGWLARFATGKRISYCLGDASNAFSGDNYKHEGNLEGLGIAETKENGFGNPGVTRFRRHMVLLAPSVVVIYDELEAESPIEWTFRLNSPNEMTDLGDNTVGVRSSNSNSVSVAKLFCSSEVNTDVTDQFFGGTVFDFQGKYPDAKDQWHASLKTANKLKRTRFITLIKVEPGNPELQELMNVTETHEEDGTYSLKLDGYTIRAQMNPNQPSLLEITSDDGECALVSGQAATEIQLNDEVKSATFSGSTMLWENDGTGNRFIEEIDQLPDAIPVTDSDGDGMSDANELIAGTSPSNSASFFAITNWSAENFILEWPSVTGREYQVFWTDNLTNTFETVTPVIDYPQNSYTSTPHSTEDTGFYKVEVQLAL